MASSDLCDPCLESYKTVHADKYCSECEEKLCAECADSHRRFKASKSHHVIDLSVIGARTPPPSKINCEIHTDVQIEYFCRKHDVVCCRACISDSHRSCETVIPLDVASKDVKQSSELSDTLSELDYMIETLAKMQENGRDNRKLHEQKSLIIKQIRTVKSKLLKDTDDLEQQLITEVTSVQETNDVKIMRETNEMSRLRSELKDNKQELELIKTHGSNNQLFIVLRKQITNIQKTDNNINGMMSDVHEIDMEFDEIKNFKIETIGSLSQIIRPCPIKYKPRKQQPPEVQDIGKPLTEFTKEGQINLKCGVQYHLTDMAVTSDNKILLCNHQGSHPKVYIFKDYKTYEDEISLSSRPYSITAVPCTDKAVVTLADEKSIQFINTTNNTRDKKIKIGERFISVTAVKDTIFLGRKGRVLILNTDGSRVREVITDDDYNSDLLYNEGNDQLLLRGFGTLRCINLDGHVIYRYDISGYLGLAVDRQGHIYTGGYNSDDIQRFSPDGTFRDIILSEDDGIDSPGGIAFNNYFTKLFIINRGETVLVYSCR